MSVAVFERRGAVWFSFKAFTAVFEVFIYSNNKWHFSCRSLVIQINPLADFFCKIFTTPKKKSSSFVVLLLCAFGSIS